MTITSADPQSACRPDGIVDVHAAPVVVPVTSSTIVAGAVAVDASSGRIVGVGGRDEIETAHPSASVIEWDGVLTPGLVNSHTHLQYTSFARVGARAHRSYSAWSERFVAEYDAQQGAGIDWGAAARAGAEAALASGTTCFGDVVTDQAALGTLTELELPGVSYLELIGIDAEAWARGAEAAAVETLQHALDATARGPASIGLSPHAPYSLEPQVLAGAAALARRRGIRLHLHLAESDAEDDYYRTGTGALAERVTTRVGRRWGVLGHGGTGMGAAEFAESLGLLGSDCHVAHGVYLGARGRALLREAGTAVALCPRSNLTVGVAPPPIAEYLAEGSPIAVGTDSLGSSPSLDLLEDLSLLRRLAVEGGYRGGDLDGRLFGAATIGGAEALGLTADLGSLEVGKRADLAVFSVPSEPREVSRALVEDGAGHCVATIVAGTTRWTSQGGLTRPVASPIAGSRRP